MSITSWLGWVLPWRRGRPRSSASGPFRVVVIDLFHKGDEDAVLRSGTYRTRRAAIAAVKRWIDAELAQHWAHVCDTDIRGSRLEELIGQYRSFAEHPVAFDSSHREIFDGMSYMEARAAALVAERPSR